MIKLRYSLFSLHISLLQNEELKKLHMRYRKHFTHNNHLVSSQVLGRYVLVILK